MRTIEAPGLQSTPAKGLVRAAWAALISMLLLTACGSSRSNNGSATTTGMPAGPNVQGQVTIFAAASLSDSFKQMGTNIERANPGTKITFNFAGSPTLRTQLGQGARADVFASADQPNMAGAQQDGSIATAPRVAGAQQDGSIATAPRVFAQNRLVVITPASGSTLTRLQDLAKPGVKFVLAQQDVPVGNYARQALQKMAQDPTYGNGFDSKVIGNVVSQELDVKQVVNKVQLGEADAGVCYATDVTPSARSRVKVIAIPDQFNLIAQYPIAVAKGAPNAVGAQQFIDYVLSPAGQQVLRDNGFILPGG